MTIQDNYVVAIDYTLKDKTGKVLDSSDGGQPLYYLHGNKNIIPGLEKELTGKKETDQLDLVIPPEEGYGERNDALMTQVTKQELAGVPDLEVGVQLQAQTAQGVQIFTVAAIEGDNVTLDGNHPLAGEELHFSVTVKSIREATKEELDHGHVHGPGGHQH